jgi:hypothetical protein
MGGSPCGLPGNGICFDPAAMVSDTVLQHVLWWLALALEASIAGMMLRKRQVRQFPLFFVFIVLHLSQIVAAYAAYRYSYKAYYYVYWGFLPVDALSTLLVIEELFRAVLAPYRAIRGMGVAIFRSAAIVLFGVAIYTAYAAPGNDPFQLTAEFVVIDRSACFVEAGLLIVLFILCSVLGIAWRSYPFGIATGLAMMVSVGTANACLRAHVGRGVELWYALVQGLTCDFGLLVWLYYLASERSSVLSYAEEASPQLAAWNIALDDILHGDRSSTGR